MHNFRELIIWQKSREFVREIYTITQLMPKIEQFGLIAQMRRAVISVVSNIAEGSGKASNKEFIRFLNMANGSACELETYIYLSFDLEYLSEEKLNQQIEKVQEIQKMIFQFKKRLKEIVSR